MNLNKYFRTTSYIVLTFGSLLALKYWYSRLKTPEKATQSILELILESAKKGNQNIQKEFRSLMIRYCLNKDFED